MLLVLDFWSGNDVLKTILVFSITELIILAVIIVIRIVLSCSHQKGIDRHSIDITDNNQESNQYQYLKVEDI